MTADGQHQSVGDRGIGVQVSGDGNTVIVSGRVAELHLSRKHLRKAAPTSELQLLRVDLRATTLVGRESERAALGAWLKSSRPIAVRCITGRAGSGKSRLAIELCAAAAEDGWVAGFATHGQFPEFVKHAAEWRWSQPILVIIDYAASLAHELRRWLDVLAASPSDPNRPPLRVLLLERHAAREAGWWADLMRVTSSADPSPYELADPPEPMPLTSLGAVEDRRKLLAEAMRLAASIAHITPPPQPPPPGAHPDFDCRLGDNTINNEPLYLLMAATEAIRSGAPQALTLSRGGLAQRAATRECARLDQLAAAWGLPPREVAHLMACITLQDGCTADQARLLIEEERGAMDFSSTIPVPDAVQRLVEAWSAPGEAGVDAIRPDLIGEAFVLQVLDQHRPFPEIPMTLVERAWRRAAGTVIATLVRIAQDYADGDKAHRSVIWLGHLMDGIGGLPSLSAFADAMPPDALALRELAAIAQDRVADGLAEAGRTVPDVLPRLARARAVQAVRLSALGRREAAVASAEEAVTLYCDLASQRPAAFRPDLAMSLNNLAAMLSDLGRRESALATAEEAVALYRELASRRPDAFRPDLAVSLNNLANRLSDLGRREAALSAAEEAVTIRRELALQRPNAIRPALAQSLNTLSNKLSALDHREAAVAAAREAVALFRELASQRPDAFRPDLAMSLSNLANRLSDLGRREAALPVAAEGAALYRELASQRPEAFGPDLAMSLNNLAITLSEVGRRDAALSAAEEAVTIRRELASQRPDAFRANLATSLAVQATCLIALQRDSEALSISAEAVRVLSPNFLANSTVFAELIGFALQQHLKCCERLGSRPDAALVEPVQARLSQIQTGTSEDPMSVELAASAVAFLAPYLVEAGKGGAKTIGKETASAAIGLLGWLREKLTGGGKEALDGFEAVPASDLNQDALRLQLAKLLTKQPELVSELQQLLAAIPSGGDTMSMNVAAGGKAAQIKGNQNTTTIG